jgi:hypothetical protein
MNASRLSTVASSRSLQSILSALFLASAASTASAQVCNGLPIFSIEGPMTAISANPDGSGSITAMGVTFQVLAAASVSTPTATLDMARFAAQDPAADTFPGRNQPGFLGATVIATGCVTAAGPVAEAVTSDVNENVLLGTVSSNAPFMVLGTPVVPLADARMPAATDANGDPTITRLGIPVQTSTIPVGANAAVEGYTSDTLPTTIYAFAVDVDGGTPVLATTPQTGIAEFRCVEGGTLRVIGGSFDPGIPTGGQAVTLVDANIPTRVFGTLTTVPTVPASEFSEFIFNVRDFGACPVAVTVNNSNGSSASTLDGPPPGPNDSAVAVNDGPYIVIEDSVAGISIAAPGVLANDTDTENDALQAVLVTSTANGDLTLNPDGSFTYVPDPDFAGTDTFTYRATQLTALPSNVATVTINVTPLNDPPTAVNDGPVGVNAGQSVTINVVANDIDPDVGDVLTVQSVGAVSPAGAGTVTFAGGNVTFAATAGSSGTVTFPYTVQDGSGLTATATVTVNVVPVAAEAITITLAEFRRTSNRWRVSGTDTLLAGQTLNLDVVQPTGAVIRIGTVQVDNVGGWAFDQTVNVVPLAGARVRATSQLTGATQTRLVTIRN